MRVKYRTIEIRNNTESGGMAMVMMMKIKISSRTEPMNEGR